MADIVLNGLGGKSATVITKVHVCSVRMESLRGVGTVTKEGRPWQRVSCGLLEWVVFECFVQGQLSMSA